MSLTIFNAIENFKNLSILVIGDAMLDRYLTGTSGRLSREAPVPIVDIHEQTDVPGGAANTAVNVSRLGGKAYFVSAVGDDEEGRLLLKSLERHQVDAGVVFPEKKRRTLTKQRVSAGNQMLVRFDYGSTEAISEKSERSVIDTLRGLYPHVDAVLVADYGYGIMTERIISALKDLQEVFNKPLMVDSRFLYKYANLHPTAVKPNFQEILALLGVTQRDFKGPRTKNLERYQDKILALTNASIAAVTVDIEGSMVFEKDKPPFRTYTQPVDNSKAIGAGDTYAAAFTLALAEGLDAQTAGELASAASAIVIQKEGTVACSQGELQFRFSAPGKLVQDKTHLGILTEQYRKAGKKVVFTNGCFDILHSGHVSYLSQAKSFGDVLIVGLNSDESIKRLKGPTRPINTLRDRIQVLSALSSIDHVVPFEEDAPIGLIKTIKPDIFVKGGDYTRETLPEAPIVEAQGGEVKIIPLVEGRSTTGIIKKINSINKAIF